MTSIKKEQQLFLVNEILRNNFEFCEKTFKDNHELLKDYNFIFVDINKVDCLEELKNDKFTDLNITSIFTKDTLKFYNYKRMLSSNAGINLEILLSLDTQILSYLYRFKKKDDSLPESINKIIDIIDMGKYSIDFLAYFFENALFNNTFIDSEIYKDNVLTFENLKWKNGVIAELYYNKLIDLEKQLFYNDIGTRWKRIYMLCYLSLLKITHIQLNQNHLSLYEKEHELLNFFNDKVFIMPDREINLGKLFFQYGTKIKFFGKIQNGKNKDDMLKNLKNMAWDIFHIHLCYDNLIFSSANYIDFVLPCFITYDKRLKDIEQIYKINKIAFIKEDFNSKLVKYNVNLLSPDLQSKYFNYLSHLEREKKLENYNEKEVLNHINSYIEELENKF